MNKKKCIVVSILIIASLIGLYLSPQNSLANNLDNGVAISQNIEEIGLQKYEPIIPRKILSPIVPVQIKTEKEIVENGRAETEIEQSGTDNQSGGESEGSGYNSTEVFRSEEEDISIDGSICGIDESEITGIGDPENEVYEYSYDFEETVDETYEESEEIVVYEEPVEEVVYEEPEPCLEYLGDWTITAYCGCAECCGSWGNATASGATPYSYHTAASNVLPFGTRVMIEGNEYVIEDTGYTIYGDEWIDIYFDSHEEALAYGLHTASVYIVH